MSSSSSFISWIIWLIFRILVRTNCLLNNFCQFSFLKIKNLFANEQEINTKTDDKTEKKSFSSSSSSSISSYGLKCQQNENEKTPHLSPSLAVVAPKEWNNPKFGNHHFIKLKEVTLHYVKKGNNGDPLMLCIHGFPECWFTWHRILEHFGDNYNVVAVDLRGFSLSEKPFGVESYKKDKIVEDLKQLIEALGYKDCIGIGQGVGSLYLWELVTEYPSMVKKMISIQGSHPSALVQYMKQHWSQALLLIPIFFFHLPFLPEILYQSFSWKLLDSTFNGPTGLQSQLLTQEQLDCYQFALRQKGALTGALNHYRAIFLSGKTSTLFKITTPGLLIWGCKDPFLQVGLANASKRFVENLTVELIPQSGHWVVLDQPAMVHKHIEEFLNQ